jgi:hypothetical protein
MSLQIYTTVRTDKRLSGDAMYMKVILAVEALREQIMNIFTANGAFFMM